MVAGSNAADIAPGRNASFALTITGTWSRPMSVYVSDSEDPTAVPRSISIVPSTSTIQPGASSFHLGVVVAVGEKMAPGNFTLAVTVTNGGVQQTAYIFIAVT